MTCLLRSRGFSLAELPRHLESAQCGNGSPVMFLRVPSGSVFLQKVEHLPKNLLKERKLCLTIRARIMTEFDELSGGKHQVFRADLQGA